LLAGELLGGVDVPEPEFRFQSSVILAVMRPVTSACALMVFQFANCGAAVDVDDFFDIGSLVDRRETIRYALRFW